MACKFLPLGCPINEDYKCCFECEMQNECKLNEKDCVGMPQQYKDCDYYEE